MEQKRNEQKGDEILPSYIWIIRIAIYIYGLYIYGLYIHMDYIYIWIIYGSLYIYI